MLSQIRKFAPLAAVAGYATPYATKGWDRIIVDLQTISVEKLQAKWHNAAIAVAAYVAIHFIKKMKMPPAMKVLAEVALYYVMGYQVAMIVDPPYPRGGVPTKYVAPRTINPYSSGRR
jgi:hypothetical protein